MAGRYRTQGLSSFSWRREAEMSAARQRLSRRTEAPPARPIGRRSVWRVLGYTIVLAVLAAAIFCVIAYKLRWPGITGFHRGPVFRSADARVRRVTTKGAVVDPLKCRPQI